MFSLLDVNIFNLHSITKFPINFTFLDLRMSEPLLAEAVSPLFFWEATLTLPYSSPYHI